MSTLSPAAHTIIELGGRKQTGKVIVNSLDKPGYVQLNPVDGTPVYLFAKNDGTLATSATFPTDNNDGTSLVSASTGNDLAYISISCSTPGSDTLSAGETLSIFGTQSYTAGIAFTQNGLLNFDANGYDSSTGEVTTARFGYYKVDVNLNIAGVETSDVMIVSVQTREVNNTSFVVRQQFRFTSAELVNKETTISGIFALLPAETIKIVLEYENPIQSASLELKQGSSWNIFSISGTDVTRVLSTIQGTNDSYQVSIITEGNTDFISFKASGLEKFRMDGNGRLIFMNTFATSMIDNNILDDKAYLYTIQPSPNSSQELYFGNVNLEEPSVIKDSSLSNLPAGNVLVQASIVDGIDNNNVSVKTNINNYNDVDYEGHVFKSQALFLPKIGVNTGDIDTSVKDNIIKQINSGSDTSIPIYNDDGDLTWGKSIIGNKEQFKIQTDVTNMSSSSSGIIIEQVGDITMRTKTSSVSAVKDVIIATDNTQSIQLSSDRVNNLRLEANRTQVLELYVNKITKPSNAAGTEYTGPISIDGVTANAKVEITSDNNINLRIPGSSQIDIDTSKVETTVANTSFTVSNGNITGTADTGAVNMNVSTDNRINIQNNQVLTGVGLNTSIITNQQIQSTVGSNLMRVSTGQVRLEASGTSFYVETGNIFSSVTIDQSSDRRLKSNIQAYDKTQALGEINNLKIKSYVKDGKVETGVIADEVGLPVTGMMDIGGEQYQTVKYGELYVRGLAAVQALSDKVDALVQRVGELEAENARLRGN